VGEPVLDAEAHAARDVLQAAEVVHLLEDETRDLEHGWDLRRRASGSGGCYPKDGRSVDQPTAGLYAVTQVPVVPASASLSVKTLVISVRLPPRSTKRQAASILGPMLP